MHNGEHMDAVVEFLINNSIWKPGYPHTANWFFEVRKPVRLFLNSLLCGLVCAQEIEGQLRALTVISFRGSGQFNIGFAMKNEGLHPIAAYAWRNASSP